MTKNTNRWNRRQFLGTSALGVAGLTILPSFTIDKGTAGHPKPSKLDKLLKDSSYVHKEISQDLSECAETRWLNKKVEDFVTIYSTGDSENLRVSGRATLELSQDKKYEGKNCICLTTDTSIENIPSRPGCGLTITLNKTDLSAYNRISAWIYPESTGYYNFYFPVTIGNPGKAQSHVACLLPNTWNRVNWEIADIERDAVERMSVSLLLPGCPPEALPTVKIYFGEIRAEKVQADDDWGWELKDRIAFCHSGYLPNMKKIAIAQNVTDKNFRLYNESNRAVYEREVREVVNEFGTFYELDFSDFSACGEYYLQVDSRQTKPFIIDEQALDASIWKSINFMRLLRCGEDIPGVHSACHLNCKSLHTQTQATVPNFGGWHDAGDLSQFEICTAEIAQAMLELALRVKNRDKKLYERLVKEGKVGIAWLLRTRFGDGSRALAVSYGMWRDNVLQPDNESIRRSVAENGPFENFLASAACAVAAGIYKEEDAVFANWCLRVAEEDFYFAKKGYEDGIYTRRWGTNVDAQVCGAAALAAAELYALTGKEEYVRIGAECAQTILSCQKSDYPDWKIPIRGFFYENPAHTKTLTYEHRGHEQSPIHGLVRLYELVPNHPDRAKWKKGLELYAEYVYKTCELTYLYHLLPAHVYELDKLNIERFTVPASHGTLEWAHGDLQEQVKTGIKLGENAYLRALPVAIQRRGYHATLLSKAKAVSLAGRVLNDKKLLQIAMNQIEWVLGKNPFASSTMYGEGYNYHPLYVAYSGQMVGSLPVGIMTKGHADLPYWPVLNSYVYKEIWGHTTGKYLFVLADLV
ncbi:MAG: glycoside hydrolase family 9 protein [Bacteroidales bacterium]|nr:glycoside hydrolase family 9 protein [Bacteroidales bacterium]